MIFFYTFSMALYNKWDVKNDFAYVLQFFSLISDDLGGVLSTMVSVSTVQPSINLEFLSTGGPRIS